MDWKEIIKSPIFQYVVVFALGFGLYANTIGHDYAYDDNNVIKEHLLVQQGFEGIPTLLTSAYRYGYVGQNIGLYRPFSLVSYALEIEFFGPNPNVSHFVNVLIYALTGLLLLLVLKSILKEQHWLLPFLIAMLFIAHPIHTEVVANIKSRDELLSFFFVLVAIFFLFKNISTQKIDYLFNAFIFFLFALLSKESAISFLAVVPLMLFICTDLQLRDILKKTLPLFVATGIYLILVFSFIDRLEGGAGTLEMANTIVGAETISEKWATTILILGKYIWLLIFPHPLICDYSAKHFQIVNWGSFYAILSLLVHVFLLSYALLFIFKKNLISFSILFYFITIALLSNVFIIISWTLGERYLYVPSLGFCIIVSHLLIKLYSGIKLKGKMIQLSKRNWALVLTLIMISYSYKTISRNLEWENNFVLFEVDIEKSPNNARLNLNMGKELLRLAQTENDKMEKAQIILKGIDAIKKSVAIYPDYAVSLLDLGSGYAMMGQYEAALASMQRALEVNPGNEQIYNNVGLIYNRMGELDKAILYLKKAISLGPNHPRMLKAYLNLGDIYARKKMFDEAIKYTDVAVKFTNKFGGARKKASEIYYEYGVYLTDIAKSDTLVNKKMDLYQSAALAFQKAIRVYPQYVYNYHALGTVYYKMNKVEKSIATYSIALQIDSTLVETNHNMGVLNVMKNDHGKAIEYYSKAIKFDPTHLKSYMNISDSYFRLGNYEMSIASLIEAKRLNPKLPQVYYNLGRVYKQIGLSDSVGYYYQVYKEMIEG